MFVCVQVKPLLMHRGPAGHRRALIMEPCGVNCFRLEISQPVVDTLCQLAGNEDHKKSGSDCPCGTPCSTLYNTKMCHNSKVICFHQHFTTYFVPELMLLSFCTDGTELHKKEKNLFHFADLPIVNPIRCERPPDARTTLQI